MHALLLSGASTKYLWEREPVYAPQNEYSPMMAASSSLVCVLGDTAYPPRDGLHVWTLTLGSWIGERSSLILQVSQWTICLCMLALAGLGA